MLEAIRRLGCLHQYRDLQRSLLLLFRLLYCPLFFIDASPATLAAMAEAVAGVATTGPTARKPDGRPISLSLDGRQSRRPIFPPPAGVMEGSSRMPDQARPPHPPLQRRLDHFPISPPLTALPPLQSVVPLMPPAPRTDRQQQQQQQRPLPTRGARDARASAHQAANPLCVQYSLKTAVSSIYESGET